MRWPSLGACTSVPCPLGAPVPRGAPGSAEWGGVVSSAWLVPPASVSSPVLGVAAVSPFFPVSVPLCLCGGSWSARRPGSSPGR